MEKLTGEMVLVNPNLPIDPANRQGEIGIITQIDIKNDEVYVGFGNQPLGLYSSDALLMMKPAPELYKDLLVTGKELDKEDFKTVMSAHLMQERGSVSDLRQAFEILKTNSNALEFGTTSLDQKLGLALKTNDLPSNDMSIGR